MNEILDPGEENLSPVEREIEKVLRPQAFEDFTGQHKILENLKIFVQADVHAITGEHDRRQALSRSRYASPVFVVTDRLAATWLLVSIAVVLVAATAVLGVRVSTLIAFTLQSVYV